MILRRTYRFEASHVLPRHPGRCRQLHGHSYTLIVVIEDDRALANLVVAVARRCGEDAEAFATAEEALAIVRETPLRVTIALADLETDGRGGDWLAREIAADERLRHIRVVLLSGDRDLEAKAGDCGAAGWLRKPFSLAELEKVIRGA